MSYVLQTIVFVLAIMGTLFKSTATDPDGKTIYLLSGLPLLTRTGKVVVGLLLVSFGLSLWGIRAAKKSDDETKSQRDEMAGQLLQANQTSKVIDETVKKVLKDQKEQFVSLLGTQESTGNKIAGDIRSSADQLRSTVENSSTVIRGRLNSSIDILNHSAKNIESLADALGDIKIDSLSIEFSLNDPNDPQLADIRKRLDNPATAASELEQLRQMMTGSWPVLRFYKTPFSPQKLMCRPDADLNGILGFRQDISLPKYDPTSHSLTVEFGGVRLSPPPTLEPTAPTEPVNPSGNSFWDKGSLGRINGIPDLLGSEFTIEFFHTHTPHACITPGQKGQFQDYKVILLEVTVSREHHLMYADRILNRDPRYYIDFRGFFVIKKMQSLIDVDGGRVYYYTFPKSWRQ
jgi:hypothetical protein